MQRDAFERWDILRGGCKINFRRVLSANSPVEPPHRAQTARRGPRGARHKALITGDACAPAGAAPFAATREQVNFATHS